MTRHPLAPPSADDNWTPAIEREYIRRTTRTPEMFAEWREGGEYDAEGRKWWNENQGRMQ